jgi:hypothetical protein
VSPCPCGLIGDLYHHEDTETGSPHREDEDNMFGAKVCFCTLAIHKAYRERARRLIAGAASQPWVVLTDVPEDFSDLKALNVRAIAHQPTGPMATDYLAVLPPTGEGRGAAAYHDKRFALMAALEGFKTAIYVDADSSVDGRLKLPKLRPGLAVLPVVQKSVRDHLTTCGEWRLPAFIDLARHLTGSEEILTRASWCHETLVAITKDGRESAFFDAWSKAAAFLQAREVFSGEGGVIGLAAALAGWSVDYTSLDKLGSAIKHEGGGPKTFPEAIIKDSAE